MKPMSSCFISCAGIALAGFAAFATDVTMRPDGEVKTLSAALEKVRTLRASGAIPAGRAAEVAVEPGRYPVKEATVFTPADSNVRFVAATIATIVVQVATLPLVERFDDPKTGWGVTVGIYAVFAAVMLLELT